MIIDMGPFQTHFSKLPFLFSQLEAIFTGKIAIPNSISAQTKKSATKHSYFSL